MIADHESRNIRVDRDVVAVVLVWRGRVGIFKRAVGGSTHDRLWHGIAGEVRSGETPLVGAARQLLGKTGLLVSDLQHLKEGPVLRLGLEGGVPRRTHTFVAVTESKRVPLLHEQESLRWVKPQRLARFDGQDAGVRDIVLAVTAVLRAGGGVGGGDDVCQAEPCELVGRAG
ncbi:NUDIX domain-containing protein [Nocardioides sp.]|uniref:NUDIX domain-containing protein n=1 Tax=Nocardioides sp. TaxID=35761 RepID=UPI003D0E0DA4